MWFRVITVAFLSFAIFIGGCASAPADIGPTNISQNQYSDWDCKKIKNEIRFLTDEISELSGRQAEIKRKDSCTIAPSEVQRGALGGRRWLGLLR